MESEEGEILEPGVLTPGEDYDPSYEWPGESSTTSFLYTDPPPTSKRTFVTLRPNQPTFRLIVLRSSILSSKHRLGVIDGHSEIQFGRDVVPNGSTTPKIRLKEMQVSKLHATAYWDASRREWGVVDMGSMHGTFLKFANATGDDHGVRLSPPRQASIPKKLSHMDQLTIGGTTFLIHMHKDRLPCQDCQTDGNHDIPLYPVSKSYKSTAEPSVATPRNADDSDYHVPKAPADPKKALSLLKKSLLTRHSDSSLRPSASSMETAPTQYVDRSARRRALMPATQPDAPGVSTPPSSVSLEASTILPRSKSPSVEPTSQPAVPLPASNIGHRLLMKQGWEPGTALGSPLNSYEGQVGLVEPLEPTVSLNRGGLGLKRASTSTTSLPTLPDRDWKETGKRRRWDRS
ncbi:hypothetical protein C0992_005830 [Termitomyces sp. T32_za158]|nr:hypothetical protein C0992_005830 [Termitomyces sp. T32_za158]